MRLRDHVLRMIDGWDDEAFIGPVRVRQWREWAEQDENLPDQPAHLVNQTAAAEHAGVSTRTIRDWEASGRITNHGERNSPLYDPTELPRRRPQESAGSAYDPGADAREIVGEIGP